MRRIPAVLAALAAACSDYGLGTASDGAALQGEIAVEPASIDFGMLEPGEAAADVFRIASTGTAGVRVEALELTGSAAFTLSWDGEGDVLAPGEYRDVVVTYEPLSPQDEARVAVRSSAAEPVLYVEMLGAALVPAASVDPASLYLESVDGEPVSDEVRVQSVGTAPLELGEALVQGEGFSVQGDLPAVLEPGEDAVLTVTFTPAGEYAQEGRLWLSTNTDGGSLTVQMLGEVGPAELGLAEAWDRGLLDISMDSGGDLVLENVGDESDILIDAWYVYISPTTQDSGAGDEDEDAPGGIALRPGESGTFGYHGSGGPAWWCIEETQYTARTDNYEFTGARVPEPLLSYMLDRDQDAVWDHLSDDPVVVVGRSTSYLELQAGASAEVRLEVRNLGRVAAEAMVSETVLPGFSASGFSLDPASEVRGSDGSVTYGFSLDLDAALDTPSDEPTDYDSETVSYLLTRTGSGCAGRTYAAAPAASWEDEDGTERTATGSPLTVVCR